ncbi:MAG: 16S rRNA (guanine(527)-N(7))-methyltransferase RsmG [Alphaproteobacteria bacterium]|nr:MAG: 16S rRNA (guanine(527)-N(7))-methyltransferase RsmG [Alphaproteobacteria bacterium]
MQSRPDVSRETWERLEAYIALLRQWQPRINLVGASTLPHLWHRHVMDSAQLYDLLPPKTRSLADIGSGAGFPGMVLAIMGVPNVNLIESDQRKGAFLAAVAAETGVKIHLHMQRLEEMHPDFLPDVVTARALAPLPRLLGWLPEPWRRSSVLILPKGRDADREIEEAGREWRFDLGRTPSLSDPDATILRLTGVRHA